MTQDEVCSLFEYKDEGLFWKDDRYSNKVKDKLAGSIGDRGYRCVKINNKLYKMHRLVYLFHKGYFPKVVDHINGNKLDNRIENLRDVSQSVNSQNRSHSSKNKTGIRNVTYDENRKKYGVRICVDYFSKWIGEFSTIEEAALAAINARKLNHEGYTEQRATS